jgi:Sodium/hydrogen exchanger family
VRFAARSLSLTHRQTAYPAQHLGRCSCFGLASTVRCALASFAARLPTLIRSARSSRFNASTISRARRSLGSGCCSCIAGVLPLSDLRLTLQRDEVGGGLAGGLLLLAGRTNDHLVEITLTTIAAYGSFLIAERVETSGVLASLTAGMVVGNIGWRGYISESGRSHVLSFWQYAAFLTNSIVFIVIGLHEAAPGRRLLTQTALIAIALVLLGRVAAVYPLSAIFNRSSLAVHIRYQHILVWGGLRGALSLVLALTLPANLPEREEIIVAAFAVVAFSIFVQGLTMPPLIRRLGLVQHSESAEQSSHCP